MPTEKKIELPLKVLVIGTTGFIGRHIAGHLKAQGVRDVEAALLPKDLSASNTVIESCCMNLDGGDHTMPIPVDETPLQPALAARIDAPHSSACISWRQKGDVSMTSRRALPKRNIKHGSVFFAFLRLGLTSFGGPVAHIGYFHDEFVVRRKWLNERAYADLVALCHFLPGPASSQVGIGIGLSQAGMRGAIAAWIAFTMPSALLLILFGYGITVFGELIGSGALRGLKIVTVAVVAQAVWTMGRTLCPDAKRATLAALATIGVLSVPSPYAQAGTIILGGLIGWAILRADATTAHVDLGVRISRTVAMTALTLFFGALVGLPVLASVYPSQTMALIDAFYRSGSLVFGGGHVVLPLLQSEVVAPGWVSNDAFLAGYGAAQAMPGPLFTFAAFLGTVMDVTPNGVLGGLVCLLAIFASSFLLVIGVMPFWDALRQVHAVRNALLGVNAAVVGLLLAALYDQVWTSAIGSANDFGLTVAAFLLLVFWKTPPWLVVILTAFAGWTIHAATMS